MAQITVDKEAEGDNPFVTFSFSRTQKIGELRIDGQEKLQDRNASKCITEVQLRIRAHDLRDGKTDSLEVVELRRIYDLQPRPM